MNSIEQAREALTKRITGYLFAGGMFNPELADHSAVRDLLIECREVLASPSTPVDGVGAEPRVKPLDFKLSCGPDEDGDETHRAHTPFGSYSVNRTSGRWEWGYCFDEYYDEADAECASLAEGIAAANAHWAERVAPIFAAAPLASPEAEARLRERVAELEQERDEATNWSDIVDRHGIDQFDNLASAWLELPAIKRVTNAVTSTFEKWANDDMMRRFREHQLSMFHMAYVEGCLAGVKAAEARLAQAEGGPAVTEVRLREALRNYLFAEEIDDPAARESELAVARQEAEAALHPQSAAGEEGK